MTMRCMLATILMGIGTVAQAEIQTETIEYQQGDVKLAGHLAWDDAIEGKRPGVLVVHEWWGLNDYARRRAEQLARMGYVAFALDMYGKGKVTQHPKEAGQWASQISKNAAGWRDRGLAGLSVLSRHKLVDGDRLAAIGYCFGGATVLQLAYAGADLDGIVSFHGSLPVPSEQDAAKIGGSILVCHGADDGFIPEERIVKFRSALTDAEVDWQMIYYGGARHGFTNPGADKYGIEGVRYNRKADMRSWREMEGFLADVFRKAQTAR